MPAAIVLAVRLVPAEVMAECRARAAQRSAAELPRSWAAAVAVVLVWRPAGLVLADAYSGRSAMSVGW